MKLKHLFTDNSFILIGITGIIIFLLSIIRITDSVDNWMHLVFNLIAFFIIFNMKDHNWLLIPLILHFFLNPFILPFVVALPQRSAMFRLADILIALVFLGYGLFLYFKKKQKKA